MPEKGQAPEGCRYFPGQQRFIEEELVRAQAEQCDRERDTRSHEEETLYPTGGCGLGGIPAVAEGRYEAVGAEIGRLVDRKQKAYGRSFDRTGEILRVLYPHGVAPERYDDLAAMIRIIDKFFRIARHRNDPMQESPWTDVAGYALLKNRDYRAEQDPPDQECAR
ncbi:MAG: hypothetical protein PHV00_06110 [Syntrophales bacterium]|jgi:hypothetical protein|nr:hypothetical protein [Syntrophales bacterium]